VLVLLLLLVLLLVLVLLLLLVLVLLLVMMMVMMVMMMMMTMMIPSLTVEPSCPNFHCILGTSDSAEMSRLLAPDWDYGGTRLVN
jgi:fatty-acid desaturase